MALTSKYFCVVKDGSPPDHNDDAALADPDRGRFAVSDGAAESGFSRIWSKIMVEEFVRHPKAEPEQWSAWLPQAQQRWLEELKGVEIPWYGEQQFQQGSFATFLGVVVKASGKRRVWHAAAVGDTCLFHLRGGEQQLAFPLEESAQFSFTPKLVGSRSAIDEIVAKRAQTSRGIGQPGDRLWLMSDALAKWCLSEDEASRSPWDELIKLMADATEETFASWVADLRTNRGLYNDDVTLMVVEL